MHLIVVVGRGLGAILILEANFLLQVELAILVYKDAVHLGTAATASSTADLATATFLEHEVVQGRLLWLHAARVGASALNLDFVLL